MHLRAIKEMEITFRSGEENIRLEKGETIHTENSQKFTVADIEKIGQRAGIEVRKVLTDDNGWFSLSYYEKE